MSYYNQSSTVVKIISSVFFIAAAAIAAYKLCDAWVIKPAQQRMRDQYVLGTEVGYKQAVIDAFHGECRYRVQDDGHGRAEVWLRNDVIDAPPHTPSSDDDGDPLFLPRVDMGGVPSLPPLSDNKSKRKK